MTCSLPEAEPREARAFSRVGKSPGSPPTRERSLLAGFGAKNSPEALLFLSTLPPPVPWCPSSASLKAGSSGDNYYLVGGGTLNRSLHLASWAAHIDFVWFVCVTVPEAEDSEGAASILSLNLLWCLGLFLALSIGVPVAVQSKIHGGNILVIDNFGQGPRRDQRICPTRTQSPNKTFSDNNWQPWIA